MTEMFAYADDSGTHQGAKFCLVLGYVASPRQWKYVRRDWRRALGKVPEFHSKEFFQRESWQSSKSPYHRWSDKAAELFLGSLLDTTHRYRLLPIGGAVNVQEFFSYSVADRRYLTGAIFYTMTHWDEGGDNFEVRTKTTEHNSAPNSPYFVVLPGFFVEAMKADPSSRVHLVLDSQGSAEVRAKEYFDQFKKNAPGSDNLESITYTSSDKEAGLQAADLYAYVWHAHLSGKPMTPDLTRAFDVVRRKKSQIVVAGKRYFDSLLARRDRESTAAIEAGRNLRPA